MAWRGREKNTDVGLPPDGGLFWYLKLTESVDDGFANDIVELLENRG
jgi:hypothetical protein